MKHLLDSNTLIEAKNRYYGMAFCPGFWQWIRAQNDVLEVASISLVAEELKRGNDDLAQWAKDNACMFLDVSDEATQRAFVLVAGEVARCAPAMKVGALDEFMLGADPWLIAKAMATGAVVVTHETFNLDVKKKFLIPNLCKHFGVPWMNTFDLLHKLGAQLILAA
ncbi:DUF4411 domain-containing protein [Cupriavidus oxalaticus]|uniref:DUF4411 family protein n=1 Tax=Cupriavidus oxalaticus TaxID=96344 RepID=UPI003F73ABF1